jgi:hypothetical protein
MEVLSEWKKRNFEVSLVNAYIDQVTNMRCGFMDKPVGEYKLSQLHKYPHLRVLGAPVFNIYSVWREGSVCFKVFGIGTTQVGFCWRGC